jgi:uncharacterized protein YciI
MTNQVLCKFGWIPVLIIVKAAGPLLDDDEKPCGSLIILELDSKKEAEDIAAQDPYANAGLFEKVDIKPYTWIFHAPEA